MKFGRDEPFMAALERCPPYSGVRVERVDCISQGLIWHFKKIPRVPRWGSLREAADCCIRPPCVSPWDRFRIILDLYCIFMIDLRIQRKTKNINAVRTISVIQNENVLNSICNIVKLKLFFEYKQNLNVVAFVVAIIYVQRVLIFYMRHTNLFDTWLYGCIWKQSTWVRSV